MTEPKEKQTPAPIQKEYFSVKVETLAPVTLTYKIYAESPEKAVQLAIKQAGQSLSSPPQISFGRLKHLKATVYNAGTNLIRLAKTLT